ncbi:hypothetical protein KBY27_16870 [Ruegeria pomeroyi]|uniref:Uncharacterized protein n=1 Tax=Ruegeria pomeroyi TaxID=89184 RepID=A0A9Q3ZPJ4_9RHOB|nr:hypothetical protein [Ruegeria pomeroyi]MCE8539131.1 hypothetical protein [Ruegeria pomeroyi]
MERFGRSGPDQPAFELDNWTVQEVRFLAAIYLGNGESSGVRLYPLPIFRDIDEQAVDAVIEDETLLKPLLTPAATDDYFMAGNHGLLPQKLSQYQFFDWDDRRLEQATTFFSAADVNDPILVRGLHALLKSEMLFNHFQFRDASLASSHIALDAAYSMILRQLRTLGARNPSSYDAQAYMDEMYGVPHTQLKFFEDFYTDRVRNFHTDSRYGAEPIPFFSIDDIWDLNAALKGLFYRLVTGDLHDETRRNRDEYLRYNMIEVG